MLICGQVNKVRPMEKELRQEIEILHAQVCQALADPIRLMIIFTLAKGPMCVNDLALELEVPQSSISRHLRVLRDRALVETQRQGVTVMYSLADERIIKALEYMRAVLSERLMRQVRVVTNA